MCGLTIHRMQNMSFGCSVSQLGHAKVCTCLLGRFLASQSLENVQLLIPVCLKPSDFSLILSTAAVHWCVTCKPRICPNEWN